MFQTDLLKGRTILITGGGTGLGRAMALRFAELGASLFLVGRREDPLKETARDIVSQRRARRLVLGRHSRLRRGRSSRSPPRKKNSAARSAELTRW